MKSSISHLPPTFRILAFAVLLAGMTGSAVGAQITAPGTDYVSFWSGDLRVFAHKDGTRVEIIDIDTNATLDLKTDPRVISASCSAFSNPFVLAKTGDMFRCTGGLGGPDDEIRVRILSSDPGAVEEKPVTVWTGSELGTQNAWGSYIPASFSPSSSYGSEVGRSFLGFTQQDLILVAPTVNGVTPAVTVRNLDAGIMETLTFDANLPSCPALVNATPAIPAAKTPCYLLDHPEVQTVYMGSFQDDRILVSSNVEISVLAGYRLLAFTSSDTTVDLSGTDWSSTPPSFAAGDAGIELGTKFFAFVRSGLAIFPTEDDTAVTITDLSDQDDTLTFTLTTGTVGSFDYGIYTPYLKTDRQNVVPRTSGPRVSFTTNSENPIDNDVLKIESDKPILVYQGPVGSNVNEFADVAFSVATGPQSRVVYAYAQNYGGSNDFQLFAFQRDTTVDITSLSFSRASVHHDFNVRFNVAPGNPPTVTRTPTNSRFVAEPTQGDIQHFGSGAWSGELLRIESNNPILVISGDYDKSNFGAYIPFVPTSPFLPPKAQLTVDPASICPGDTVSFNASNSFDQDELGSPPGIARYDWDFGDGAASSDGGPQVGHTYKEPGTFEVKVTVTDNETSPNTQTDSAFVTVIVLADDPRCAPASCTPKTQGYWNRQCKGLKARGPGPHPDFPDLKELQTLMDGQEKALRAVCDAEETTCDSFETQPPKDPCEQACKQYAALLLNLSSGLLDSRCDTESGSARDVADQVSKLIDADKCKAAADLADAVNTGDALRSESSPEP